MLKQKLQMAGWGALGLCCIVLLVAAMKKKDHKTCSGINIKIQGAEENVFIKEADIKAILKQKNIAKGEDISAINLRTIEDQLERNPWIKDAELYFDNSQELHAAIRERVPIARVFTTPGGSFYIDSSVKRLPLSDASVARLPVFTGFPSDKDHLSVPDSLMLNDVKDIARFIIKDSFWNAQTAQVNIKMDAGYQLIPVLGNQVIEIGDAQNLDEKFQTLYTFYQQVWSKVGFEKYETISVKYKGQVVAVRRGAAKPLADSSVVEHLMNSGRKVTVAMSDTALSVEKVKPKTAAKTEQTKKVIAVNDQKKKAIVTDKTVKDDKKKKVVVKAEPKSKPQPKAVMKKPSGH